MTKKQDLQQEILANVTAGITPSALKKKLKRSKSDSDISSTPTVIPLTKSQSPATSSFKDSKYPYTTLISQQEELDKLQKETTAKSDTIFLLRKKIEELEKSAPIPLLTEQLKEKQAEIESLRKQLEQVNQKLTQTTAELDNSLEIRHQSLKDWTKQQEIIKDLNQELDQTIDQTSEELVENDNTITNLRTKINRLKTAKESLERELKSERIKKGTYPNKPLNFSDNFLQYSFYALLALAILVSITVQEK